MATGAKNFHAIMPVFHDLLCHSGIELRDVNCLAVAIGPGSFTGLRVGLSLAKGICQGLGIPVIGVSSLEAMASQCPEGPLPLFPIIDSRKGEVFAALFRRSKDRGLTRITPDTCLRFDELPGFIQETSLFVGNDFDHQPAMIRQVLGSRARLAPSPLWSLKASSVGWVGMRHAKEKGFERLVGLVPSYLRPPDIRPNPFSPGNRIE
jgi:tRNA threonylcarbamoyladenosine biosynthesis protein TsaB